MSVSPEASLSLWHANRFVNPYFWFEFENPEDAKTIEAMDRWMEMFANYYRNKEFSSHQDTSRYRISANVQRCQHTRCGWYPKHTANNIRNTTGEGVVGRAKPNT